MCAAPNPQFRHTFRNRYLSNAVRHTLRRAVNVLPGPIRGLFPPSDLRRQIRMHPEDRDTIDPEWRVRAGKPAPTERQIRNRRNYIMFEKELARMEIPEVARRTRDPFLEGYPEEKEKYVHVRAKLAALLFDSFISSRIENIDIYHKGDPISITDRSLLEAMHARAGHAYELGNLSMLPPLPDTSRAAYNVARDRFARQRNEDPENEPDIPPEVAARLDAELAALNLDEPPAEPIAEPEPIQVQPGIQGIVYDDLPDLGPVNVEGDDIISYTPFVQGEQLVVVTIDGFQYKYKREGILDWFATNQINPITGTVITIANLSRATANVQIGGKRKLKRQKTRKTRKTRKMRKGRRN